MTETPIYNDSPHKKKLENELEVSAATVDRYDAIIKSQSPFSPSLNVRRKKLVQRLSADLLPLPGPDSLSVPEGKTQLRRSASHEILYYNTHNDNNYKYPSENSNTGKSKEVDEDASSMDSLLAKQALLAAKVLHLIPVGQARERNYLQRRVTASSLLGSVELDRVLPDRTVSVFVGTWNMNGQEPPLELNDLLLPEDLDHVHDIVAIGTQESYPEKFEWEVKLQETIGPTHVLLHSTHLGTLHLAVFLRRDLLWYCSVPEDDSLSVRPGTAFRTKGAVAIGFILFGTSYLFVNSHLTAHQDKVKERISDVKRIVKSLDLPRNLPSRSSANSKDVTQNFDCVFWCGDLNFRLNETRENVLRWVKKIPLKVNLFSDQLNKIISDGTFAFEEGDISFAPTYKFDPGTDNYDTSHKQRTPSYTDRILFRCNCPQRNKIECKAYAAASSITTSDHKPVWGIFTTKIRPGIDKIPLAAGLFNREVYLEGIKRRVEELQRQELGLSTVCSLQ